MATKKHFTDAKPSARDHGVGMETNDKHALKRRLPLSGKGKPGWLNIS